MTENKYVLNSNDFSSADYQKVSSVSKDNLKLVQAETNIHDQAFETKPVSYLRDSFNRFCKNKSSIVAAIIILLIIVYGIIAPFASSKGYSAKRFSEFKNGFRDPYFKNVSPYLGIFKNTGFWDGTTKETVSESVYYTYKFDDSNHKVITQEVSTSTNLLSKSTMYIIRRDTYAVGNKLINVSKDEYNALVNYEKEKGIYQTDNSIMKPLVDSKTYIETYAQSLLDKNVASTIVNEIKGQLENYYNQNASAYYQMVQVKEGSSNITPLIKNGKLVDIYKKDTNGNNVYFEEIAGNRINIRVDYFDYFTYKYDMTPYMVFGANSQGQDIYTRLASGALFSIGLGVVISLINFVIGLIYGAISGYYGGTTDLIMERITDIISNVPSVIILTICQIQFTNNIDLLSALKSTGVTLLAILVAFVYNGWVGVASTTRMQFYRFKGQEYVIASRTLGAKDRRLIFRHILPNAIGTLVTSSVLMIPGVIFSESSLSYLGIIDFTSSGISSIGTLLQEGQNAGLRNFPHVILFPCIVISLLMICFNLFGNGLRDAFNTSLKGSEE